MLFCSDATAEPRRETAADAARGAFTQHLTGRSKTAQRSLERFLEAPDRTPAERVQVLETLLEICVRNEAEACLRAYAPRYGEAVGEIIETMPAAKPMLARRVVNYLEHARFTARDPQVSRGMLDYGLRRQGESGDVAFDIQRQVLVAQVLSSLDDDVAAAAAIDRLLATIAALENPSDQSYVAAAALADATAVLLEIGETERAYGVIQASSPFVTAHLPSLGVETLRYALTVASALQAMRAPQASIIAADEALRIAAQTEMEPDVRGRYVGDALAMKALASLQGGDWPSAQQALAQHPAAVLYVQPGRAPADAQEIAYLTVRALSAALGGVEDPIAREALAGPRAFEAAGPSANAMLDVYRTAGAALSRPAGTARSNGLIEAGQQFSAAVDTFGKGQFGAWRRGGAVDAALLSVTLSQADRDAPGADEAMFALFQLTARLGRTYDADALTALSQAQDEAQRRDIHAALRLRARRDRLERDLLSRLPQDRAAPAGAALRIDAARRDELEALSTRLDAAGRDLAAAGVSTAGANLVSLADFQAVLRPNEVAVAVAPTAGAMTYMCVRRDQAVRIVAKVDTRSMALDSRLLEAALTAGHPPSEALDAQFPVAASVRLYATLIQPIESCLRPGDHMIWLAASTLTPTPLAVLLPAAPPRLGEGYDLSQADWLVRRHAVSYAGSASLVVAARGPGGRAAPQRDFLGVGDPFLAGTTASGEDRRALLTSGSGLSSLAALPDTAAELRASAQGFRRATLLTGEAATERAVRGELAGAYRYISFATHGLVREELPGLTEPALALTPVGADPADDGLLTASDIADLSLTARFVALSACNTANFDLTRMSQELPALASAFAVAGAPATLGTLWAVDSESSRRVVSGVFGALRDGETSPAEALADSQRAFLAAPPSRAHLHPRFWAPFVMLGDGG